MSDPRLLGGAEQTIKDLLERIEELEAIHIEAEILWWDEKGVLEDKIAELEAEVNELRTDRCSFRNAMLKALDENKRLTDTQKYLCNCLEEVGVDSSAALAAAEGITLPEECPFSGEVCDCTDDRGIRAKRCPRTITKHPYGYCPICLRPGVNRERRPNGNDRCSIGHEYPSAQALYEDKT